MILQNIRLALRTIRGNKLRSTLTMLGIIISVSSVMIVISVGQGVENQVRTEINNLGANILFVNPGDFKNDEGEIDFSNIGSIAGGANVLSEEDAELIGNNDQVQNVAYSALLNKSLTKGGEDLGQTNIFATTSDYPQVYGQEVEEGTFFTGNETGNVAVLGNKLNERLFGTPKGAIGGIIKLGDESFVVIGVMEGFAESIDFLGGPSPDNSVLLPFSTGEEIAGSELQIQEIAFRVDEDINQDEFIENLNNDLLELHSGEQEFTILTQEDTLELISTIFGYITTFVALVASLSLLVGAIGIMNIMLVSVTERTREIGLRKALGATNLQVLSQFLIESIILSAIGGLIGVGVAYGAVAIITILTDINGSFSLINIFLATGVAAIVGVLAGLWPAWQAARKDPIESLRHE